MVHQCKRAQQTQPSVLKLQFLLKGLASVCMKICTFENFLLYSRYLSYTIECVLSPAEDWSCYPLNCINKLNIDKIIRTFCLMQHIQKIVKVHYSHWWLTGCCSSVAEHWQLKPGALSYFHLIMS